MSTRNLAIIIAVTSLSAIGESFAGQAQKGNGSDPYVVVLTESDSSPERLLQSYPEVTGAWEDIALYNLLRPGRQIELTRDMLSRQKVLAKMVEHYGEAEVRRLLDKRFMPVVKNLMLREGDVLRTWRKSGGRILFDDGIEINIRSNSRLRLDTLGSKDSPSPPNVRIRLMEGSIWSRVGKELRGRFEIETPSAITIIRGTDFRLKVEAGNATRLEVLDGLVELKSGDESIEIGSQEGVLSLRGEALGSPRALPPPPGALLAPQPKEVFRSRQFNAQFRWRPVPEAQAYRIEIALDPDFFDIVEEQRTTESSVRIMDLAPGTYFWRVMAINQEGFEGPPTQDSYFVFVRLSP